jgi:hypothetical protein
LPANFSAINDAGTTDSDVGLGLLDLRGLGANRTLVLINGRRHVAGGQGSAAVDINSIPSVMLKQVETLTGGASSVYGADAVSGVVNFLLRKGGDFDGFEITAQTGMSTRWDNEEHYLSAAGGFDFAEGRGEAVIAIEGLTNSHVYERDRDFAGPFTGTNIQNDPAIAAAAGISLDFSRAYIEPVGNPISSPLGAFSIAAQDSYGALIDAVGFVTAGTGIPLIPCTNIPIVQVIDNPFAGTSRAFNPGLPANVSHCFGVGDGLRIIVDYYNTEIEGAIDALSPERIAEVCVDLGSTANQFCPLIERAPEGFITFHQSDQVSLGTFEVSGIDFALDYGFDVGELGSVNVGVAGTHLLDFDEFQDPTDSSVVGTRVGEFGFPEWIYNVNASWTISDRRLSWAGRYEDSQLLNLISNQQIAGNPLFVDPSQTGDS